MNVVRKPANIYAAGLVCPAGHTFRETVLAYANRERFLQKENAFVGVDGLPPTIACVYRAAEIRDYAVRLRRLLDEAHTQCLAQLPAIEPKITYKNYPLVLVLPFWFKESPFCTPFMEGLAKSPLLRVAKEVNFVFGHHAESLSVLLAIKRVFDKEAAGIFVAAVDSFIHADILDALFVGEQILQRGTAHGLIPGEGAVSFFLSSTSFMKAAPPLGSIIGLVQNTELIQPYNNEGALIGKGLADCYRKIASLFAPAGPDRFIVDLNGERYRAEEFGFSVSAIADRIGDLTADPETPSNFIGDCGAAMGLMMVALALGKKQMPDHHEASEVFQSYRHEISMISASSWAGLRAAALILSNNE